MRLNDNNSFIGINPPYQLSVIHSSKLIYPREIYQLGEEIYCEALRHIVEAWEGRPDSLQQVGDLSVPEYLTRWLRESVMNLSPDTYGRYAYDMGRVIIPYFERKRLSLKALTPRDLETFFRYERQQEEATVQQLLDWHRELTDALQYAVDSNWLKANPVKTVDPCLDNSPVLFNDFLMDWLKMMKSRVAITTYANYEIVITRRIVPYAERAGAEPEGLRQGLLHGLSRLYLRQPDGQTHPPQLSEPAFPGFSGRTPDEAYPLPRPAP